MADKTTKEPKEDKKAGVIEVNESTLRDLIKQNEELSKQVQVLSNAVETNQNMQGMKPMVLNKKKDTFLKVKMWQDKVFLGYENVGQPNRPRYVYSEYNPTTREQIEFCNVILRNSDGTIEKPLKVRYVDFMRDCDVMELKQIKRIELDDTITTQGMVQKKDFASNGYGTFITDIHVPVEVVSKNYAFIVQLEDGTELELPESALA